MKYLLDTCVISEIIRPQPDENVISWVQGKIVVTRNIADIKQSSDELLNPWSKSASWCIAW